MSSIFTYNLILKPYAFNMRKLKILFRINLLIHYNIVCEYNKYIMSMLPYHKKTHQILNTLCIKLALSVSTHCVCACQNRVKQNRTSALVCNVAIADC